MIAAATPPLINTIVGKISNTATIAIAPAIAEILPRDAYLVNFSLVNFSLVNFSLVNFSLVNFSRLNFIDLNFTRPERHRGE
jgi:uncharacterized protein YjbI with pentapeptide repeats